MPTGYTADIVSGKMTSVAEFAKLCLRNFGATMHMRDDSLSAEYRPRVHSEHHKEQISRIRKQYEEYNKKSLLEIESEYKAELLSSIEYSKQHIIEHKKLREILESFIVEVSALQLDSDYANLKDFMLDQLRTTLKFDASFDYYESNILEATSNLNNINAEELKADKIRWFDKELAYHQEQYQKEVTSCEKSNEWVNKLFIQLGLPPVIAPQPLACENCGDTGEDVQETIDPYLKEIENEEVMVTLCDNCLQERCDDI